VLEQDLGCCILGHSRNGENIFLSSFYFFRQAKISQFHVAFFIEHDVLGFQVSIDNIPGVHVVQGQDDLRNVKLGSRYGKGSTALLRIFI